MTAPPTPTEIYQRAQEEGERRLSMSPVEQVSTGFIDGVTVVFGIVAFGVTYALIEPSLGADLADLFGAAAFALGLVFLVVGRSELFTENFFGPVAAAIERRDRYGWLRLARLWLVMLILNLVGGVLLITLTHVAQVRR